MALAFAKLLIAVLSTVVSYAAYASVVLFKGTAVLIVLALRLVRLPGCLVGLVLCAVRAGAVKVFAAACAAGAGALAMVGAASACRTAVSSHSAAVEAARGKPEALLGAAVELSEYAWEVAKITAWNSTETARPPFMR